MTNIELKTCPFCGGYAVKHFKVVPECGDAVVEYIMCTSGGVRHANAYKWNQRFVKETPPLTGQG